MNKKLIAAAIAAAMAAPAAFAGDVTVYGKLHASIDSVDEDGVGGYDGQAITSRASRLGFKGSEDLGNGLKAVWKLEFGVDIADGGVFSNRDHYLGLAGNFGTFLAAGNINTPYKNSTGKMDFFGDTLADYNSTLGFEDNRVNNALVYISPKFNGLQFSGAIISGEGAAGTDGLADAYSLALTYNNAGISGAIAYEDQDDTTGAPNNKWRVGLGYKMEAFNVAAVYESEDEGTNNEDSRWIVSGSYTMGNNTIKAMYGSEDDDSANTDNDAWAVGVDHKMSKRTKVYALYTDSERGLRGESSSFINSAGSGFSVGMIHSF